MELVQQYIKRWTPPPVSITSPRRMYSNQGYESGTITSNNVEFPFEYTQLQYTRRQESAPMYMMGSSHPVNFSRGTPIMELSMQIPMDNEELFEALERRNQVDIVTEQFAANAVAHGIRYLGSRMAEVSFECSNFRILFQS